MRPLSSSSARRKLARAPWSHRPNPPCDPPWISNPLHPKLTRLSSFLLHYSSRAPIAGGRGNHSFSRAAIAAAVRASPLSRLPTSGHHIHHPAVRIDPGRCAHAHSLLFVESHEFRVRFHGSPPVGAAARNRDHGWSFFFP